MPDKNIQDGNVGNLGDILKHAALVQLAKVFSARIHKDKYYLDSHSYLYQSRLAAKDWRQQTGDLVRTSPLYQEYIDLEAPCVKKNEYLCSSGIIHKLIPDAHLLLCETNRETREWLLQQLADNRVSYHTVKEQMSKWVEGESFEKLPNLLALIDPFELTDELWASINGCMGKMLAPGAEAVVLIFDYKKEQTRDWPVAMDNGLTLAAQISHEPYHLAVYTSPGLSMEVIQKLGQLNWQV